MCRLDNSWSPGLHGAVSLGDDLYMMNHLNILTLLFVCLFVQI